MIRLDNDTYVLSTGRTFYAASGVLGIKPEEMVVTYGVAGVVRGAALEPDPDLDPAEHFTPEERVEIAAFMIAEWTAFSEAAAASSPPAPTPAP